jgi:hypothetical protein
MQNKGAPTHSPWVNIGDVMFINKQQRSVHPFLTGTPVTVIAEEGKKFRVIGPSPDGPIGEKDAILLDWTHLIDVPIPLKGKYIVKTSWGVIAFCKELEDAEETAALFSGREHVKCTIYEVRKKMARLAFQVTEEIAMYRNGIRQ